MRSELDNQPIRILRLQLHLTIQQAADLAGVNYQAWYLTECGCYTDPLPAIVAFLQAQLGVSPTKVKRDYYAWIATRRRLANADSWELPEPNPTHNPVAALYKSLGFEATKFAKLLCIQPAILYKVDQASQEVLPQQLKNALLEAGMNLNYIEELQERYDEYRARVQFRS